jgi:hypothetical protein
MVQVAPAPTLAPSDERAAREQLRSQIAALEGQLSDALVSAFPHDGLGFSVSGHAADGPHILSLGELESVRDGLASGLAAARAHAHHRGERQAAYRALLQRMLLEPGRYKFVRIANRDLGKPGCGAWQVRPRMGLIGMLMGWWQVKLSSGCPLSGAEGGGHRRRSRWSDGRLRPAPFLICC